MKVIFGMAIAVLARQATPSFVGRLVDEVVY
jgi:hypothetical protein